VTDLYRVFPFLSEAPGRLVALSTFRRKEAAGWTNPILYSVFYANDAEARWSAGSGGCFEKRLMHTDSGVAVRIVWLRGAGAHKECPSCARRYNLSYISMK